MMGLARFGTTHTAPTPSKIAEPALDRYLPTTTETFLPLLAFAKYFL